jgi:hypothetical protein
MKLQGLDLKPDSVIAKADQLLAFVRPPVDALIAMHGVVLSADSGARPTVRLVDPTSKDLVDQFSDNVSILTEMVQRMGVHGRRLHVLVSDYWARPLTLQLAGNKFKDDEIETVLKSQYRRQFAESMDDWTWCWERQGAQLAAVAWPMRGLKLLRQDVKARNCILASALPLSIDVAKQMVTVGDSTWLAIVEIASVTLVRQQKNGWCRWLVIPADRVVVENLGVQLTREAVRCEDECRRVMVVKLSGDADMSVCHKGLVQAGWSIKVCSPSSAQESRGYFLSRSIATAQ